MHLAILNGSARVSFVSSTEGRQQIELCPLADLTPRYQRLASVFARHSRDCQPVILALSNSAELLLCIWACLFAGIPFVVVSPDRLPGFLLRMERVNFPRQLVPSMIVEEPGLSVGTAWPGLSILAADTIELAASNEAPLNFRNEGPDRIAYYQLTSGSSGAPKAVPISFRQLMTNIGQVADRCELRPSDRLVLWVPMSHDMGLVTWLTVQAVGASLRLFDTRTFVRSPLSWLTHASEFRATVSSVPSFALSVTARLGRRRARELALDTMRVLWVGGEPVFPRVVREFTSAFAPAGLHEEAIHPSYGMSEAVVAVSMKHPGEQVKMLSVCAEEYYGAGRIRLAGPDTAAAIAFTSNGRPLDGVDLNIWGEDRRWPLPEDCVGRLVIRGPNIVGYYVGQDSDLEDGWRDTGDLGFLHEGEIYITGRRKDVLIRGGVNISAEQVEQTILEALSEEVRRAAVLSIFDHRAGVERVVIVCESRLEEEDLRQRVASAVIAGCGVAPDKVFAVPRGSIPMTSSGKIRRQELRLRYQS